MQFIYTAEEHGEAIENKALAGSYMYNRDVIQKYFSERCAKNKNGRCDGCPILGTMYSIGDWGKCLAGFSIECSK